MRGAGLLTHEQEVERDEHQRHCSDDIDELAAGRLFHLGVFGQHEFEIDAVQRRDDRHDDKEPHAPSVVGGLDACRVER